MSKASEWARLRVEIGSPYSISSGRFAQVTQEGNLTTYQEAICVDATPEQAVAFARWILDTFGDQP